MKTLQMKIEGIAPMLMHNWGLSDRKNPIVQEMKRINSKKTKLGSPLPESRSG